MSTTPTIRHRAPICSAGHARPGHVTGSYARRPPGQPRDQGPAMSDDSGCVRRARGLIPALIPASVPRRHPPTTAPPCQPAAAVNPSLHARSSRAEIPPPARACE